MCTYVEFGDSAARGARRGDATANRWNGDAWSRDVRDVIDGTPRRAACALRFLSTPRISAIRRKCVTAALSGPRTVRYAGTNATGGAGANVLVTRPSHDQSYPGYLAGRGESRLLLVRANER